VLCDQSVEDALPQQMYLEYFSPEYRLNHNRRPVSTLGGCADTPFSLLPWAASSTKQPVVWQQSTPLPLHVNVFF
jgi:hypothetical protein